MKSRHFVALAALLLILAIAAWAFTKQSTKELTSMTPEEIQQLTTKDTSVVVLDVRTVAEYMGETGHLAGAVLIPVQELDKRWIELEPFKGRTIVAYCRSGHRSGIAATLLNGKGFKTINMQGGMLRWSDEKRPVVREVAP